MLFTERTNSHGAAEQNQTTAKSPSPRLAKNGEFPLANHVDFFEQLLWEKKEAKWKFINLLFAKFMTYYFMSCAMPTPSPINLPR